ncbi:MAG TPA: hypothetical protein VGK00_13195, partial [Anaerolineales bacterium]
MDKKYNRAWILGLSETGLSALRSLGRAKIPVTGVDWKSTEFGCFSRFGVFELSPSPVEEPQALLEWFIQRGRQNQTPGILLPAADAYAAFVSKYRDALAPFFLFALPSVEIMDALLDKYSHARLAEEMDEKIPYTALIDENTDLRAVSNKLRFPAYVKARHTHLWNLVYNKKGFKVNTQDEFIERCGQIIHNKLTAVA